MLFNSITFLIFFTVFFVLYWILFNKKIELRNSFILIASYLFYGWWDWRFLFLLIFSTLINFYIGKKIFDTDIAKRKKAWLIICLFINLGFLGVFKYYNFFITSFVELFSHIGIQIDSLTFNIILPIGISFYTFHGLSYIIDIYKQKISVENNIIDYSVFVSFFPLLIAGPIERATHLLPQIKKLRVFDYNLAVSGMQLILLGFFKKVFIADNCAPLVNQFFDNYQNYSGSELLIGAICFSCQIYGDFSGYSDMAIGFGRLLQFDLMTNFRRPYFSRNIAEFWRRWHISLTSWLRDYLYIPLGGSRYGINISIRNTIIIFIVSGFWHGANWTFIVWGGIHALLFIPLLITGRNRMYVDEINPNQYSPNLKESFQIISTFLLISVGWIFFRANTIHDGVSYLSNIFSTDLFTIPTQGRSGLIYITICFIVDWCSREGVIKNRLFKYKFTRWLIYAIGILTIYYYGSNSNTDFIYFQF